jgi:hypothetical protein
MLVDAYFNLPEALRRGKNESELWIEVGNYGRIELKGADNEDSLRGSGLDGVVVDEVASIQNFDTTWHEVLRPALTDRKGWGMFISTPKGYNHFYSLWKKEDQDADYKSFQFTSYDNPHLIASEIDKAKEELTEDTFAQEYLADFRKHTGLVYKEFERKIHIIDPIEVSPTWRIYRTMDFGAVNPTVCLWIAIDYADRWYVFDEYYQTGKTAQFHANVIQARSSLPTILTIGDPSAQQEILDYANYGVYVTPALKLFTQGNDWVNSGIDKVKQMLKVNTQLGRPQLFVFKNCENTIREFESYRWMEKKNIITDKEVPVKENDHCMDALRYAVCTVGQEKNPLYEDKVEIKYNEFTSYSEG